LGPTLSTAGGKRRRKPWEGNSSVTFHFLNDLPFKKRDHFSLHHHSYFTL
jgi:hypothetical protein